MLLILVISFIITLFFVYVKWKLTYWSRCGLLNRETKFFVGTIWGLLKQDIGYAEHIKITYDFLRKNKQIHGGDYFFLRPIYIPVHPTVVKHVMSLDFPSFTDRGLYYNEEDPIHANMFFFGGTRWKKLRTKMTPTFTSGKIKMMFDTLTQCSTQLEMEIDKKRSEPVDIKDILGRYTTDVIGSVAFGVDINSLKNPNCKFRYLVDCYIRKNPWQNVQYYLTYLMPKVMRLFNHRPYDKIATDFCLETTKKIVDHREQHNVKRNDFMDMLIQLKNNGKLDDASADVESDKLTFLELAAQASLFFGAGFESTSTMICMALYELASNQKLQDRLREEISRELEKYDGKMTYEAMMSCTYLDQVINETFRLYPILNGLDRVCTKTYNVPGTDVVIEKGTKVIIPVVGLQRDPEYYPDPMKFDPERFSEENIKNIQPFTFIPFGAGPRFCIAERFGRMQTKVGLATIIKDYKLTVNPKTKVPIDCDPKSFFIVIKGGIWLNFERVNL
ncbi:unnamed protein product [Brassicogethes aeneus]|uniref:Cytochrome P450 n=1 Tax=Brassicogethes aeneus TaxID=1431903 RepID=A0A9P0BED0_BRAAE|nr:unnamed protein product [Brassicogethes aeneus]